MIRIDNGSVTVKNGKDGKATILLTSKILNGVGCMTLRPVIGDAEIGINAKDVYEKLIPDISVEFNDVKSVEAWIRILEDIKNKMNNPLNYVYLCA